MEVIEIVEMGSNEKYQNGRIELTQLKMVGWCNKKQTDWDE